MCHCTCIEKEKTYVNLVTRSNEGKIVLHTKHKPTKNKDMCYYCTYLDIINIHTYFCIIKTLDNYLPLVIIKLMLLYQKNCQAYSPSNKGRLLFLNFHRSIHANIYNCTIHSLSVYLYLSPNLYFTEKIRTYKRMHCLL